MQKGDVTTLVPKMLIELVRSAIGKPAMSEDLSLCCERGEN